MLDVGGGALAPLGVARLIVLVTGGGTRPTNVVGDGAPGGELAYNDDRTVRWSSQ